MTKTKLVVGNWKMHPTTLAEGKEIVAKAKRIASKLKVARVVVCPSHLHLGALANTPSKSKKFTFGGQNMFESNTGSHTGEVSPAMLKKSGAQYVILGHSERRALGETDASIAAKVRVAHQEKLIPIVCIGEHERDTAGTYLSWLEAQITTALQHCSPADIEKTVLAYEPLWAIGAHAKQAITPHELHQTILFIKKVLITHFGTRVADKVRILYGGSVDVKNTESLIAVPEVGGFLIGRASLSPDDFVTIIKLVEAHA